MAGNVQGINVIINGDASPFLRAMRQAQAEATTMSRHMAALNKLIKFDPTSTTLITRKQQLYNAQLAQNVAMMDALRRKNQEFAAKVGPLTEAQTRQWMTVQRRMTEVELKFQQLRADAIAFGAGASASAIAAANGFSRVGQAMSNIGTYATMASAAVALVGAAALRAAAEFESSFAGVRKTIIATEDEYEQLAEASRRMALEIPVDVNDINKIMELGGQLNIVRENLVKFADTMARLDVSTDMGLEEGSLQLARFINISGMAQEDVDRLGATIVDLGNNSATTESQIMTMAMRIVGSASNIGMTATDVLGLATALSSVGIQAEMGGNAISTIMNRIDKDVALSSDKLAVWAETAGMSASEFAAAWSSDVTGTFQKVITGMGTFRDEGGNLNTLLKDMGISYMRQVDTMQRLSRTGDLMTSSMARASVAFSDNTALVRESAQRFDTAESRMQLMRNTINELGIEIGQGILPYFKELVDSVASAVHAFAQLDEGTKSTLIQVGALAVAAGPLLKGLGVAATGVGKLIGGMNSLKTMLQITAAGITSFGNASIVMANVLAHGTEALGAADAAALEAASGLGLLSAAQQAAAATSAALEASIGLSLGALAGIVGVAVAATAALVALNVAYRESIDPMNQMTTSGQLLHGQLEENKAQYRMLEAAGKEWTAEGVKLKSVISEQEEAYHNAAVTLGDFLDAMHASTDAAREQLATIRENRDEAQKAAGAALTMGDELEAALGAYQSDSTVENLAAVQSIVFALNSQVDGLALAFDDATGAITSDAGDWKAALDDIARQNIFENEVQSYSTARAEMDALQDEFLSIRTEYDEARKAAEKWDGTSMQYFSESPGREEDLQRLYALQDAVRENRDAYGELAEEAQKAQDTMQATVTHASATEWALERIASGEMDAAEAADAVAERFGVYVDAAELSARRSADFADMVAAQANAYQDLVNEIDEVLGKNEAFAAAMGAAGITSDDLALQLSRLGLSAEDLAGDIGDAMGKITDGFSALRVDDEDATGAGEYFGTLEDNTTIAEQWASDMQSLWDRVGEGADGFMVHMAELGPENYRIISELANSTDEELANYIRIWEDNQAAAAGVADEAYNLAHLFGDELYDALAVNWSDFAESAGVTQEAFRVMVEQVNGDMDLLNEKLVGMQKAGVDLGEVTVEDGQLVDAEGKVLDLDDFNINGAVNVDDASLDETKGTLEDINSLVGDVTGWHSIMFNTNADTVLSRVQTLSQAISNMPLHSYQQPTGNASEGIVPGHADGGIFTRATMTNWGWVGEAGTEALIPLSNRRYVQPFADAVADGIVGALGESSGGARGDVYIGDLVVQRGSDLYDDIMGFLEDTGRLSQL